ncbi:hypothetical protein ACLOJK_005712 [Asimina triloba]
MAAGNVMDVKNPFLNFITIGFFIDGHPAVDFIKAMGLELVGRRQQMGSLGDQRTVAGGSQAGVAGQQQAAGGRRGRRRAGGGCTRQVDGGVWRVVGRTREARTTGRGVRATVGSCRRTWTGGPAAAGWARAGGGWWVRTRAGVAGCRRRWSRTRMGQTGQQLHSLPLTGH